MAREYLLSNIECKNQNQQKKKAYREKRLIMLVWGAVTALIYSEYLTEISNLNFLKPCKCFKFNGFLNLNVSKPCKCF